MLRNKKLLFLYISKQSTSNIIFKKKQHLIYLFNVITLYKHVFYILFIPKSVNREHTLFIENINTVTVNYLHLKVSTCGNGCL